MDTNWIDDVLRTNTAIVAAEARLNGQVAKVLAMITQGQDTAGAEARITIYAQRLVWLRRMQADLLGDLREQA